MQNSKEDLNIKELYGKQCVLPKEDFLKKYNLTINGLSSQETQDLLHKYGINQISQSKSKKWYNYLVDKEGKK